MSPAVAGAQTGATRSPLTGHGSRRRWAPPSAITCATGTRVQRSRRTMRADREPLGRRSAFPRRAGFRPADALARWTQPRNGTRSTAGRIAKCVRFLMAGPRFYLPLGSGSGRTHPRRSAIWRGAARDRRRERSRDAASDLEIGGGLDWRYSKDPSSPSIRGVVSYAHAGDRRPASRNGGPRSNCRSGSARWRQIRRARAARGSSPWPLLSGRRDTSRSRRRSHCRRRRM
jgi:hypothetical protein